MYSLIFFTLFFMACIILKGKVKISYYNYKFVLRRFSVQIDTSTEPLVVYFVVILSLKIMFIIPEQFDKSVTL